MSIQIRPRTDDDIDTLVAALAASHKSDAYPVFYEHVNADWLQAGDTGLAWVAMIDGSVAGHIACGEEDGVLTVHRMFVAPNSRGQGAASALLGTVERHADAINRNLALEVMSFNTAAIALYERHGWIRTGSHAASAKLPRGLQALIHEYTRLPNSGQIDKSSEHDQ